MLALHRARLRPQTLRVVRPTRPPHLSNRRFLFQSVCDGFLDLALALPVPPSLPTYSTAIILVTVVTRCAFLPISIWGRNRTRRIEEVVLPEIESLKPAVSKRVFDEMRAAQMRGSKKELNMFHAKKCISILTAKQKELFKQHKCSPRASFIVPALSQLPIFIGFSFVLARLSVDPTPFDSETFLTLTSLAHPDPTMTLPVVLGFLSMANVESGNWVLNAAEREQQRESQAAEQKRIAEGGEQRIRPGQHIKSALRGLSILRIIFAAVAPGGVALYWVTSAAFGLVQTWVMQWQDIRRRRKRTAFQQALNLRSNSTKPSPKAKR